MTKATALYKIYNFGVEEEYQLVKAERMGEAYQIRCARARLLYALLESIKYVGYMLNAMTRYTIDKEGYWHYDPMNFVHDEYTRQLLVEFREKFDA